MSVRELNPAPVVVGACLAVAAGLFLAEPFVAPIPIEGVEVPIGAFSFVVFAIALDLGAVLFYWQGDRSAAFVHGVAGLAWTLLLLGPVIGDYGFWLAVLAIGIFSLLTLWQILRG